MGKADACPDLEAFDSPVGSWPGDDPVGRQSVSLHRRTVPMWLVSESVSRHRRTVPTWLFSGPGEYGLQLWDAPGARFVDLGLGSPSWADEEGWEGWRRKAG